MLAELKVSDFDRHIEAAFPCNHPDGASMSLELIEARALGVSSHVGAGREPFSLIFLGPERPELDQRIHPLKHPTLGPLEIFLVPIGPAKDRAGRLYQAIFS